MSIAYGNCKITYKGVEEDFADAYEVRGITTPAYYRLLIPIIISEYDKVLYSDVDVIFRMDLTKLYSIDLGDNYLAATRDVGLNLSKDGLEYINSMPEMEAGKYLQSGFIILNNKKIREKYTKIYEEHSRNFDSANLERRNRGLDGRDW